MNIVVSHNTVTGEITVILADIDPEKARKAYEKAVAEPVKEPTLVQWFRRPTMPFKRRVVQPPVKAEKPKKGDTKPKGGTGAPAGDKKPDDLDDI